MPDPHRLERELREILSKPRYVSLLVKQGEAQQEPVTAASLANEAVKRIMADSPFERGAAVEELKGGRNVELYRAYDGIGGIRVGLPAAMTLGAYWCDRQAVKSL